MSFTVPTFQKAKRTQSKLKIAITGPSGAGKTYSALRLASGISSKIAFIDTENGSASLYSDNFDFDVINMSPPFSTEKYIQALEAAEKAGYEVIVIDSITHAWAGEGGLLAQKEQLDQRGGNSFANWGNITKKHEIFKSAFLQSKCHIICTIRSKQEYSMSNDDKGKSKVQKLGMAPIQRDGMEYEFTTVFDIAMNHEAETSKDRTGLFADRIFKITEETGKEYLNWMSKANSIKKSGFSNEPSQGTISFPSNLDAQIKTTTPNRQSLVTNKPTHSKPKFPEPNDDWAKQYEKNGQTK